MQKYLVDIWDQISVIVVGHPANKDKFCIHIQKVIREAEKYGKYLHLQWKKAKKAGLTICDKNKNEKEWSWWTAFSEGSLCRSLVYFYNDESFKVQFYIKGKPEPDPLWYLASMIQDYPHQEYKGLELLDYQFTLLAIIYDAQNWSAGRERIYFNYYNPLKSGEDLKDRICHAVWVCLLEYDNWHYFRPVKQTIETAMLAVRAELDREKETVVTEAQNRLERTSNNEKHQLNQLQEQKNSKVKKPQKTDGNDETPKDLIDLYKAVIIYNCSRSKIKRDIKNDIIKDYRKNKKGKHMVSISQVDSKYTRRKNIIS